MKESTKKLKTKFIIFSLFLILISFLCLEYTFYKKNYFVSDEKIKVIEQNALKYANNHIENPKFYNELINKGYKYISVYEIVNSSNMDKSEINNTNGYVKITYEDGLKAKYIKRVKNLYTIYYYANDYKLDKYSDVVENIEDASFPNSISEDVSIEGWTFDKRVKEVEFLSNEKLTKNKVKKNVVYMYAITNRKLTLTIDNSMLGLDEEKLTCNLHNKEKKCSINLPLIDNTNNNITYNTKKDMTGYMFYQNEEYDLYDNEVMYVDKTLNNVSISGKENYVKDIDKYNLIISIDSSSYMKDLNSFENIKEKIKNLFENLDSENVNIVILDNETNKLLKTQNKKRAVYEVSTLKISKTYNYNTAIYKINDYIVNSDIDKNIVLIISNNKSNINEEYVTKLKEISSVYTISLSNETSEILGKSINNNYLYEPLKDNMDLDNLAGLFNKISGHINMETKEVKEKYKTININDNLLELSCDIDKEVIVYDNDKIIGSVNGYLMKNGNRYIFDIKEYLINNNISIDDISNISIEYYKYTGTEVK